MKKFTDARTDEQPISHLNLRSRLGSAFVAGCLALSVCPTLAFAATNTNGSAQDAGNPPAAMQFDANNANGPQQGMQQGPQFGQFNQAPSDFTQNQAPEMQDWETPNGEAMGDQAPEAGQMPNGEAPDMSQAPNMDQASGMNGAPDMNQTPDMQNGQAPNGMAFDGQAPNGNQPRTDAMSEQVRQILSETYGITLPTIGENGQPDGANQPNGDFQPGNMGNPGEAPELPEGATNVQQVIDTARDILREYSATDLQDKIGDADFVAALQAYALSATEQRLAMFASNERPTMENPSDLPSDQAAPATEGAPSGEAPSAGAFNPNDAESGDAIDGVLMSQIISLIMDVFGYVS